MQWFVEELELTFPAWTDPERAAYRAARFHHSMMANFTPGSVVAGLRAFRSGHRQSRVKGDPNQQGGVLIALPDGRIPWVHQERHAGDHAPAERVLDELTAALA